MKKRKCYLYPGVNYIHHPTTNLKSTDLKILHETFMWLGNVMERLQRRPCAHGSDQLVHFPFLNALDALYDILHKQLQNSHGSSFQQSRQYQYPFAYTRHYLFLQLMHFITKQKVLSPTCLMRKKGTVEISTYLQCVHKWQPNCHPLGNTVNEMQWPKKRSSVLPSLALLSSFSYFLFYHHKIYIDN